MFPLVSSALSVSQLIFVSGPAPSTVKVKKLQDLRSAFACFGQRASVMIKFFPSP